MVIYICSCLTFEHVVGELTSPRTDCPSIHFFHSHGNLPKKMSVKEAHDYIRGVILWFIRASKETIKFGANEFTIVNMNYYKRISHFVIQFTWIVSFLNYCKRICRFVIVIFSTCICLVLYSLIVILFH